jgi:feruloyl-CoA synthase
MNAMAPITPLGSDLPARAETHPLRPISFGDIGIAAERRDDGTIYIRSTTTLTDYPVRITDRLHHWAETAPDRVFMAERNAAGGWREISYAQMLSAARKIGSALLARGLSAEKPVMILSGNSIDHALMMFGALYAGIAMCPVSPPYSLVSKDFGKLHHIVKLLTPGLVFADNASAFAPAILATIPSDVEIAASRGCWRNCWRRLNTQISIVRMPRSATTPSQNFC